MPFIFLVSQNLAAIPDCTNGVTAQKPVLLSLSCVTRRPRQTRWIASFVGLLASRKAPDETKPRPSRRKRGGIDSRPQEKNARRGQEGAAWLPCEESHLGGEVVVTAEARYPWQPSARPLCPGNIATVKYRNVPDIPSLSSQDFQFTLCRYTCNLMWRVNP
jgi:hypothetical protein